MNKYLKQVYLFFLILPTFAIGRFFDERLIVGDINISIVFSIFFFLGQIAIIIGRYPVLKRSVEWLIITFFLIIILVFCGINWLIWGINDFDNYSLGKVIVLAFISYPTCICLATLSDADEIEQIYLYFSVIGFLMIVAGAMSVFRNGIGEDRLAVFGGGPIVFSRWIGLFIIVLYYREVFGFFKVLKIILLVIGVILMILSGSKGPILFLFLLLFLWNFNLRVLIGTLFVMVLVFFFFREEIISLIEFNAVIQRTLSINSSFELTTATDSTNSRLDLVSNSIVNIIAFPLGVGLGNFSLYIDTNHILELNGYPHNIFLELLIESGVVVFLFFLFINIYLIKSYYFLRVKVHKVPITVFLFYLFNSMISGDISDARFLFVFSVLLHVYIKGVEKNNENNLSSSIF